MPTAADHQAAVYGRQIGATAIVTVAGAPYYSSALVAGARYALLCAETDVWVRQGGSGLTVPTAAPSTLLRQGQFCFVHVDGTTSQIIGAITATGIGGDLRVTRVDNYATAAYRTRHAEQFYREMIGPAISVDVEVVPRRSAALAISPQVYRDTAGALYDYGGRYRLRCDDADCYVVQGNSSVAATTLDLYLPAGEEWVFNVDSAAQAYIGVLKAAGPDTTLQITRIDGV